MKFPKSVRIGYRDIAIRVVKDCRDDDSLKLWGKYSFKVGLIEIEKDLHDHIKAEVLLHEIFHAMIGYHNVKIDRKKEEELVEVLGKSFAEFFILNPKVIKELLDVLGSKEKN